MKRNRKSWGFWLPAAVCLAAVAGCGPEGRGTVTVKGTVTLDGSPVADAAVMFTGPEGGQPATGMTDSSGNFTLEAVPGTNGVAVSKSKTIGGPATEAAGGESAEMPMDSEVAQAEVEWLVPMKYANYRTSGLEVEVKKGMDPVKLDLTSP